MALVNEHFLKLANNYLFADIAKKVNAYKIAHPKQRVISLGIGDVTQPLCPAVIKAMHKAVDEMAEQASFRGYGPERGYDFLREAIIKNDFLPRGIHLEANEVFVNDGAKSDTGNIQEILRMAKAYIDACRERKFISTIKHFPGDGVDYRDQHLMSSVNSLSVEEWDATYGHLYQELIDYGAPTVMCSHIRQPELCRRIRPEIRDEEIMPASLSSELMQGVLREKMGFNGLIVTDATQMVGFTCSMPRHLAVPACIERGADMFLFTINQKEDVGYMLDGLKKGLLSHKRLDEAVTRILALKASIGLHQGNPVPGREALACLQSREHQAAAERIADQSITLVKNKENLLPLTPRKTPKIKLIQITNERLPESGILEEVELLKELLEKEGFEVSYFKDGKYPDVDFSLEDYKKETDLVIYFANMKVGSNQTTIRITWDDFLGESSPKYVCDLPSLFLSFSNPYHLVDVPMVRTYINAYTCNATTVYAMVEKLMGRSEFKGISPVDPFAGLWDTKL